MLMKIARLSRRSRPFHDSGKPIPLAPNQAVAQGLFRNNFASHLARWRSRQNPKLFLKRPLLQCPANREGGFLADAFDRLQGFRFCGKHGLRSAKTIQQLHRPGPPNPRQTTKQPHLD